LPFIQDVRRSRSSGNIVGTSSSPRCLLRRCETVLGHEHILDRVISADYVVRSLHATPRGTFAITFLPILMLRGMLLANL
jgi:hypothetical protein